MGRSNSFLKSAYRKLITERQNEDQFWILMTFLPTFIVSRLLVNLLPQLFVNVHGVHLHHFTWGIFILAICGYMALSVRTRRWHKLLAALYGVGLALAFDELGMWLELESDYWERNSYNSIIIILFILVNTIYFSSFWKWLFGRIIREKRLV